MSDTRGVDDGLERRWDRVWFGLLLVALAGPSVALLLDGGQPLGDRLITIALALAVGSWHVLLMLRHPVDVPRSGAVAGWWVITVTLVAALIAREDTYAIVVYALYPLAFLTLGWWAAPVVAAVTAIALFVLDDPDGGNVAYSVGISTALAVAIGLCVTAFARQRAELAEALEDNRQLQGRLVEQARSAGVLEERARLAREIHDTVAQGLTSIVTQLEAADQAIGREDRAAAARRVGLARGIARESLRDARRAVADLRPELLDRGSLVEAVRQLVARTGEETGLEVHLDVGGRFCELSPTTEITLLRCAQEALANARRHSGAERVRVALRCDAGTATLTVDDDGRGFDAANRNDGAGLIGMRERLAAADGELDVRNSPRGGTIVSVRVPA